MFEPQFEIELHKTHKRVAYRSKESELSFQNLEELSSLHLISKVMMNLQWQLCWFEVKSIMEVKQVFEPHLEIEMYRLHKRVAYCSKEKELSFQNLQEFS